jgi:hypothetical protein
MTVLIEEVIEALRSSWSADTSYDAAEWTSDNPARGHCIVSSLILNDYFGGEFQKYKVHGDVTETHYANILWHGVCIDSTASQYDGLSVELRPVDVNLKGHSTCREKLLSDDATRMRYETLKARVSARLNAPA